MPPRDDIRFAAEGDIPVILDALRLVPNPPVEFAHTIAPYLENDVVLIWPATGMICSVVRLRRYPELMVRWLLPRAAWTDDNADTLGYLLARTLQEAWRRWPEARTWDIWAEFQDGRDALGQPDGGRALCEFWAQRWRKPDGTGPRVVSYEKEPGDAVYRAVWSLREAREKADAVRQSGLPRSA